MSKERYSTVEIGEETSVMVTVTEEHMKAPALLFEDHHPIHNDHEYALSRGHDSPTLAGSMIAGIMSGSLAEMLSRCGLAMLSYEVKYRAPVYEGDELTSRCTVVRKEPKPARGGGLLFLKTTLHNQDGTLIAEGDAVDLVTDAPPA